MSVHSASFRSSPMRGCSPLTTSDSVVPIACGDQGSRGRLDVVPEAVCAHPL
jgi:hypothetical protein